MFHQHNFEHLIRNAACMCTPVKWVKTVRSYYSGFNRYVMVWGHRQLAADMRHLAGWMNQYKSAFLNEHVFELVVLRRLPVSRCTIFAISLATTLQSPASVGLELCSQEGMSG